MTERVSLPEGGGPEPGARSLPRSGEAGPSGPSAPPRRLRGGRALSVVLPGLPQLFGGRVVAGGSALLVWLGLIWTGVARWDRVRAAPAGGLDEGIALATLILGLGGVWAWSLRDVARPSRAPDRPRRGWEMALGAFRRNRVAVAGALAVSLLCVIVLLTPFLAPQDPTAQGDLVTQRFAGPSSAHPLGTDQFARDVLSRMLYGARISLAIGLLATGIAVTVGTVLGAAAGFLGGKADALIMRFVDMVIAFPRLVLLITIVALFEPSILLIIVILGLTQWPFPARIVRGEILSLRERDFIQAGRALGFSRSRLLFRHLVPNALAPVIVAATLGIGDAIILEAGLSFLGLGVQPPTPSWGTMVADGRTALLDAWWLATFPGLAIVFTVLAFNLAGDGLRDAVDPQLRS